MPEYTQENLIVDRVRVNAEAREAILVFKRSKPWRGSHDERCVKFAAFHAAMCTAYGLERILLRLPASAVDSCSGESFLRGDICLRGRLSVVTYLHLLCAARGKDHFECCQWSLSMFKRFFPISFGRCRLEGFMLRKVS